jgi:hypothetical protein
LFFGDFLILVLFCRSIEPKGATEMFDLKEYATSKMNKQNSEGSIEEEFKKDRFFLSSQIEDVDKKSPGSGNDQGDEDDLT